MGDHFSDVEIRVGIYTRLSVEDIRNHNKKKGSTLPEESMSVTNQREYLVAYAEKVGWHVVKIYTDDGYSGSTFDRPGFIEMINDVKCGRVNTILVKDLSRFGRNYIEVGRYTDIILPMLKCRLLALSDGIDTALDYNNMLPVRNLLNDHYLKEVSKKIKAAHRTMAHEGKRVAGRPPYGYKADPENYHKFIVDEYAAGIVRRIFEMRMNGYGYAKIAGVLNSEGILSPREYEYKSAGKDYPYPMRSVWLTKSVKTVLHNESYIGNRVQLKLMTVSYKIPKIIHRPEDEWVRVTNVHEAIIGIDTWEAVQTINDKLTAGYIAKSPSPRLFRGLLRCPDCGGSFTIASSNNYQCIRFQQTASVECSSHFIKEADLKQIVLDDIKTLADGISIDKDAVIASLKDRLNAGEGAKQEDISSELAHIRTRLIKVEAKLAQVFEDKSAGMISKEIYSLIARECEDEHNALKARQIELLEKQTAFELNEKNILTWVELIERYAVIQDVDRDLLLALIDKIEIGKRESVGSTMKQDVKIIYRFVGAI